MKYDLKKEKIAVHCQTLEEAEKLERKVSELGIFSVAIVRLFKEGYAYFKFNDEYLENWKSNPSFTYHASGCITIPASEYLSQFEDVPKFGDKVWVKEGEEAIYVDKIGEHFMCIYGESIKRYIKGHQFTVYPFLEIRTTDPAKDKKVLELTLDEIAEKLGVDSIKIKE